MSTSVNASPINTMSMPLPLVARCRVSNHREVGTLVGAVAEYLLQLRVQVVRMLERPGHEIYQKRLLGVEACGAILPREHVVGERAVLIDQKIARIGFGRQDRAVSLGIGIVRHHGIGHIVRAEVLLRCLFVLLPFGSDRHHSEALSAEERMHPPDSGLQKGLRILLQGIPVQDHRPDVAAVHLADAALRTVAQVRKGEVRKVDIRAV